MDPVLLEQLLSFPPPDEQLHGLPCEAYDKLANEYVTFLNGIKASDLQGTSPDGSDLLDLLNPSTNSIPYLHCLLALLHAPSRSQTLHPGGGRLWTKTVELVSSFNAVQIRYAGHEFRRLLEKLIAVAPSENVSPIVSLVFAAMSRLDPETSCFTSTHLLVTKLCLSSHAYEAALPLLDNDIYQFPANSEKTPWLPFLCDDHDSSATYITTASGFSEKLRYQNVLSYFLYGGMIYLALKKWERAMLMFELAVEFPVAGSVVSTIQLEAYKKWMLTGLLLNGKAPRLSRTVHNQAVKVFRATCKAYDVLGEAFAGPSAKLQAEANAASQIWHQDWNVGLVQQVVAAHRRFEVVRLSSVFQSIPVAMVHDRISHADTDTVADTEAYIRSLIASGSIDASLSPATSSKPAFLRFSAPDFSEGAFQVDLLQRKAKVEKVSRFMLDAKHRFELAKEHVEQAKKDRQSEKRRQENQTVDDDTVAEL